MQKYKESLKISFYYITILNCKSAYMVYARSLGSTHVPHCRCGRIYLYSNWGSSTAPLQLQLRKGKALANFFDNLREQKGSSRPSTAFTYGFH
jgi:hypothetical protein